LYFIPGKLFAISPSKTIAISDSSKIDEIENEIKALPETFRSYITFT